MCYVEFRSGKDSPKYDHFDARRQTVWALYCCFPLPQSPAMSIDDQTFDQPVTVFTDPAGGHVDIANVQSCVDFFCAMVGSQR